MTQIELLLLPHEPENSISYCYPRVYFTYQSERLQDIMSQPQHFATLNALKSNIQPHAVRYFKKRHTSKTSNYEIKKQNMLWDLQVLQCLFQLWQSHLL